MADSHKLEIMNGPADLKCSAAGCDDPAVCFASYRLPGPKILKRAYCAGHGLMFGVKYKLLESRNGDVFLKNPTG